MFNYHYQHYCFHNLKSAVRGIKESQDIVSGIAKAILYPLINASAGIVGA